MAGRFVGSILAPNAEVIGNVNIDGNIVADHVNIASGKSHRFDLQTPSVTDPTDPEKPTESEAPTAPEQDLDRENAASIGSDAQTTAGTASSSTTTSNPVITMITTKHHSTKSTNSTLPQTDDTDQQSTTIWGLLALTFTGLFGLSVKGRNKDD